MGSFRIILREVYTWQNTFEEVAEQTILRGKAGII